MERYGIIGKQLSHSFSPNYFNAKFQREGRAAEYLKFELPAIEAVSKVLSMSDLKGFNVTIPYKQAIMPYLDALSDEAASIGAVNCVAKEKGIWKGYNTDVIGFAESLQPLLQKHHQRALVLGTGGASKAVVYVLQQMEIAYQMVSRTASAAVLSYAQITPELLASCPLVINTTPLGMFPAIDACPDLPYEALTSKHLCYDLIYNPATTLFLSKAQQQGATIINGEAMLLAQAEAGWRIWTAK